MDRFVGNQFVQEVGPLLMHMATNLDSDHSEIDNFDSCHSALVLAVAGQFSARFLRCILAESDSFDIPGPLTTRADAAAFLTGVSRYLNTRAVNLHITPNALPQWIEAEGRLLPLMGSHRQIRARDRLLITGYVR